MTEQQDLFKKSAKQIEDEKYNKEYCIAELKKAEYLWDMRVWHKDHDRAEVVEMVRKKDEERKSNDGHAEFCIGRLKEMKVPEDEIVDAIMANTKVRHKNRLVPCFLVECKKVIDNGGYSGGVCDECTRENKTRRAKNTNKARQA
jgi:hypothetical protein